MNEINNNYNYEQPQYQQPAVNAPSPTNILIFGIIGLALSCIPFLNIAGIIISAMGMKKSNAYVAAGGARSGQAIAGRILARIGLILSIISTVFYVIYFIVIIVAALSFSSNSYYY